MSQFRAMTAMFDALDKIPDFTKNDSRDYEEYLGNQWIECPKCGGWLQEVQYGDESIAECVECGHREA